MQTFEPIFNKLQELFIDCLPDYVLKNNEEHNDGIILNIFENSDLTTNCNKLPCFKFSTEEADYTEKDRILENTVYIVSFDIKLNPHCESKIIVFWRYVEAIQLMLKENECDIWNTIDVFRVYESKIYLRIVT